MKKIEVHTKTKYSMDYDSTIDVETILWNSLENGEKGIIFIDRDNNYSFPKIEKIYKSLCIKDNRFKNYKIGYGVELTTIIDEKEYEVNVLLKNNDGIFALNKLISIYINDYNKKIPFSEIDGLRNNLVIGIILNDEKTNLDLSLFDYIEINQKINCDSFKNKLIVYSNIPNALLEGELLAKQVLYHYRHIKEKPCCRLYMDTEDTLKIFDNENIVVNNSNKLLDILDNVVINDDKFYTDDSDYDSFKSLVYKKFQDKYKKTSSMLYKRLEDELKLVKELNYTFFFKISLDITNYVKENNQYYQINDFLNNSLVAFILGITNIEPYNLPYELFYSKRPKLVLSVDDVFYYKKLFPYLKEKLNMIICNYGHRLKECDTFRIIKHFEILTKNKLSLSQKDYVSDILKDIPIYRDSINNTFLIIPNNMDCLNFTPLEHKTYGTMIDYHDLSDNLIGISILPKMLFSSINTFFKTKDIPKHYNDKKVFDLYRSKDGFNINRKILNNETGILNTCFDLELNIENKLINIPHIWFDDLVNIYTKSYNLVIIDDIFSNLKNDNMDDLDIFLTLNNLENHVSFVSRANAINHVSFSYLYMYYKLYHPKEYYEEMFNYPDSYNDLNEIENLTMDEIIHNYKNEHYEYKTNYYNIYEILIEMYERGIKFEIKNGVIKIGE